MSKIYKQLHYINPKFAWDKIETIQLSELFKEYNISEKISQLIRFNNQIYPKVIKWLNNWDLNLFNQENPQINDNLIEKFNKSNSGFKWIITQIFPKIIDWISQPIIQESSIKICDILEMSDKIISDIIDLKLYQNWIWKYSNFEDFKKWFIEEFEWNRITKEEFNSIKKMFYRKIKLI